MAASLVVVFVLVAAGAILGPCGVALASTALTAVVLAMVLCDLLRSVPGPSGA